MANDRSRRAIRLRQLILHVDSNGEAAGVLAGRVRGVVVALDGVAADEIIAHGFGGIVH